MQITTIGLDIAKNVFQVHGIDAKEKVVVRKQLRRSQVMFLKALPPCLIGMEACATAHYWARELTKLGVAAAAPRSKVFMTLSFRLGDVTAHICCRVACGSEPPQSRPARSMSW
jgi:hypothetical protein